MVGKAVTEGVHVPLPLGELVVDAVVVGEGVGCALMLAVPLSVCVPLPLPLRVTEGVGSPGVFEKEAVPEAEPVPLVVRVWVTVADAVHDPVPVLLKVGVPEGVVVAAAV